MTFLSCSGLPTDLCFHYVWQDYGIYIEIAAGLLFGLYVWIRQRRKKDSEPLSTCDETDKSGLVHVNELEKEQEGSSFLVFERANGDVENRMIGDPFVFVLEDNTLERHHINPRGSYQCVKPMYLFKNCVRDEKELTRVAALSEQLIRQLRTGGYENSRLGKHFRTFAAIFILALCMGLGIAAATIHH